MCKNFIIEASRSHSEHTTLGRTPLHDRSARRRHLYLTTHTTLTRDKHPFPRADSNAQPQQASGPQTHALVGAGTGIGAYYLMIYFKISFRHTHGNNGKGKGKEVPLQAWSGPEGSRKLRFPDFMTTAQDGGKVVSLTHRPTLPPGNTPGIHFC